jgi:phage portal protein BeeE
MPRWLPSLRRSPAPNASIIAALEEAFGHDAVKVIKEASSLSGLLAIIRTGKRVAPRRGQDKLLQSYADMPWVRAVVGKIAESVASTEWIVYRSKNINGAEAAAAARFYSKASPTRRKRLRKQMELVELPGHPMLDVMERGNDFHTGQTIDEVTQAHIELVGEGFWLKERNGRGVPTEIWGIPPNWIIDTPAPGKSDGDQVFTFRLDGVETKIPMEEVIWFKKADPHSPYGRGVGTGRSLGDELDTDEYAAKHMKGWFVNGAIPDLLVSADGLAPGDTQRLEEDWLNKQQGFWNRFKPYFIGKKLTVEKLTASFQEMGLGELRRDTRDVIIHTWGVAPEMFGITENSNRANISGAFYQFSRWVLVPRLELKRAYLQTRLVPDFDPGLIIDYESPVEEDMAHRLEVMKAASWAFTVDEWREEGGRPELPDGKGEVHAAPFSLIFTDELGGGSGVTGEPGGAQLARSHSPTSALRDPATLSSEERAELLKEYVEKLTPTEEQIIGQVLESIEAGKIDAAVRPVLQETVIGFGQSTMASLAPGVDFDVSDPIVQEFLAFGRDAEIVGANATTQQAIRFTLAEGYAQGETIAQLQTRIEAEFADAVGYRSQLIARTETVSSANFGAHEGIKQSGLTYKGWLAVRDGVTRDGHLALDAQPPIPVDQNFTSPDTGSSGPHPGMLGHPAEDCNCRCSVTGESAPKDGEQPTTHLPTEEQRAAAWRSFESERLPYEKSMRSALKSAFRDQEKAALAAFKEAV